MDVSLFHVNVTTGYICNRCKSCQAEINRANARKRCNKKRQEERRKKAEVEGRAYVTAEEANAISKRKTFDKQQRKLARENARQAYKWWIENKASNGIVKAHYPKPWSRPGLSKAEAYKLRYRYDIEFNLKERMRRQLSKNKKKDGVAELMRGALHRNGESKTVYQLLGFTIQELREHLEKQFTPGMTMEDLKNGDIHIDHIKPQAAFDLNDPDQWLECWSLNNLQPLWAKDNFKKSSWYEGVRHYGSPWRL